jgi:hypothetical protein
MSTHTHPEAPGVGRGCQIMANKFTLYDYAHPRLPQHFIFRGVLQAPAAFAEATGLQQQRLGQKGTIEKWKFNQLDDGEMTGVAYVVETDEELGRLKQHYVESERSYIDTVRVKLEDGRVLEEARVFCRRARYPLLPEYFFFEDGSKESQAFKEAVGITQLRDGCSATIVKKGTLGGREDLVGKEGVAYRIETEEKLERLKVHNDHPWTVSCYIVRLLLEDGREVVEARMFCPV